MASIESVDLFSSLPPEERAALEKIQSRNARLQYVYQNHIQELAEDGARNGFWINLVKDNNNEKVGESRKYFNPVSKKEELLPNARVWEKTRFYYRGNMTTGEFNEYAVFRGEMLNEVNTATAEDMATRLYELGAMRFLDMNHDVYARARKDELRMVVDACFGISSWNGQMVNMTKSKEEEEETKKKLPTDALESDYITPSKLNKPKAKRLDQKTFDDVPEK